MFATAKITVQGWVSGRFHDDIHYRKCNDADGIYSLLVSNFGHEAAEDAASWCELNSIGAEYDGDGFRIEIVDR